MTDIRDTVGWHLIRAFRAHHQAAERVLRALHLHAAQELVLIILGVTDGLAQGELAERLEIEPPSMTLMLRKLEDKGLVVRRHDPDDARVMRVSLTASGRALVAPSLAMWRTLEAHLLAEMSDAEIALLRRLLLQVTANLTRAEM